MSDISSVLESLSGIPLEGDIVEHIVEWRLLL